MGTGEVPGGPKRPSDREVEEEKREAEGPTRWDSEKGRDKMGFPGVPELKEEEPGKRERSVT